MVIENNIAYIVDSLKAWLYRYAHESVLSIYIIDLNVLECDPVPMAKGIMRICA